MTVSAHDRSRWVRMFWSVACCLAAAAARPALAETTRCVDSAQELRAAVAEANTDEMRIHLVRGSYELGNSLPAVVDNGVSLIGGWDAGCNERVLDPRLTVITGDFGLIGGDFIRLASVAFIDSGYVELRIIGEGRSVRSVR